MQKTNQRRSGSGVDTAALKSLKVKTGICKRVMKELHSYEQVVDKEFAKTQNVKNSQACSFDIKRQEHVLQESYMMVPNCQKRLETALTTLEKAVVGERPSSPSSCYSFSSKSTAKLSSEILPVPNT
uniref:Tubulin-specific chaperone A n=1 Tax=Physcomitrium patens TaxID=3218 RepID=A0A2K1KIY9_PHYPA|nr:hypothetical protein PHYPA_007414 [Physcomitrium patens]